ncbi:MAG: hypothetical protein C6W57_16370 [Caldibacillus debilis]|nr:MAG: hypothetical protein C6W57_16370 [Caldibacillus debilis]
MRLPARRFVRKSSRKKGTIFPAVICGHRTLSIATEERRRVFHRKHSPLIGAMPEGDFFWAGQTYFQTDFAIPAAQLFSGGDRNLRKAF